jgi:hypothetical protein
MNRETKDAIGLVISALNRMTRAKNVWDVGNELDIALRKLADVVFMEDIHPMDPGITIEIIPVIIQLKLASRGIQLSAGKDL